MSLPYQTEVATAFVSARLNAPVSTATRRGLAEAKGLEPEIPAIQRAEQDTSV
ncbi:MAG: hypothetical protein KGJ79_11320 [Alphaproteobacteria bacterium]|nr:hypothetical protein [Alphaproteobacteria bacterium]MDE2111721.1 hypothetical protein [Alphaproteobacteria bacterium]MDE2496174.1 hypothetical protein [Alphaproteobacteria bacterium]